MYQTRHRPAQRKKWSPAANGSDETTMPSQALMPPSLQFKASQPVQLEEPEAADAKRQQVVSAAVAWGATANMSEFSIEQLQEKLGVNPTGVYDEETAGAVYDQQVAWGVKKPDAQAGSYTFNRLGVILTKKFKSADYSTDFWQQFLDEEGNVRPAFQEGISVAVYPHYKNQSNNNKEFLRQAGPWAKRHQAVGIDAGNQLKIGIPNPIKSTGEVIEQVHNITDGLFKMIMMNFAVSGFTKYASSAWRIKNLGIFAHGMPYGLSLEEDDSYALLAHDRGKNRTANVESFVAGLSGTLAPGVNVQLFACNTGREYDKKDPFKKAEYKHWQTTAKGGENSFGALLSEQLGQDATVFSHLTAGHTTRNPASVVFGKAAGSENGMHIFHLLYPDSFIDAEISRLYPELQEEGREKARSILKGEMSRHYKKTTSKEVSELDPDFKGVSTNMGAEMFTDLENSKRLFQLNWAEKWLNVSDNKAALKKKMKKAGLI